MKKSTSLSSSLRDEGDGRHDISTPSCSFLEIPLTTYLEQVMDVLQHEQEQNIEYNVPLTEDHRKKMIRCLLGMANKAELDAQLRNIRLKKQWDKACEFVENDLWGLVEKSCISQEDAPMFAKGVQDQISLQPNPPFGYQNDNSNNNVSPSKLFSYLARGKTYQGKLERLLETHAPILLPQLQAVLQEPSDRQALQWLVEDHVMQHPEFIYDEALQQVLDLEFDSTISQRQPDDGGKQLGLQGESSLTAFLELRHGNLDNDADASLSMPNQRNNNMNDKKRLVLSNVLVKTPKKHALQEAKQRAGQKNSKKQLSHVVLSNSLLNDMTSEFDALVLEPVHHYDGDDKSDSTTSCKKLQIVELWEAKASLHAVTIYDALFKKTRAFQHILSIPEDMDDGGQDHHFHKQASLYLYPSRCHDAKLQEFLIDSRLSVDVTEEKEPYIFALGAGKCSNSTSKTSGQYGGNKTARNTDDVPYQIGIFGSDLLSPFLSLRRLQMLECEYLLERSPEVVLKALETGTVVAPDVSPKLQTMLDMARRLKPILVVPPNSRQ